MLIETAVAAAILAIAAGAAVCAIAAFGRHVAQQGGSARMEALILAQQTVRVAQDAWKYGSPGSAPSGSQTLLLPGRMTASISGSSPARITVTVRYTPEPGRSGDTGIVSLSGELEQRAPLPGSRVHRTGLVPMPSGAP